MTANQKTLIPRKNQDAEFANVDVDSLTIRGVDYKAVPKDVLIKSADYTLVAADSGKTIFVTGVDKVLTLPATVAGLKYTIVLKNAGLSAGTGLSISPAAADFITGNGLSAVDDKDLILAGSGDRAGDCVTIEADGVDGWFITSIIGTWSKET